MAQTLWCGECGKEAVPRRQGDTNAVRQGGKEVALEEAVARRPLQRGKEIVCDERSGIVGSNKGTFSLDHLCWLAWHQNELNIRCDGLLQYQWCLVMCLGLKVGGQF